jgi:FKBP-type peptidyl-prolyl cis-trans isomerase
MPKPPNEASTSSRSSIHHQSEFCLNFETQKQKAEQTHHHHVDLDDGRTKSIIVINSPTPFSNVTTNSMKILSSISLFFPWAMMAILSTPSVVVEALSAHTTPKKTTVSQSSRRSFVVASSLSAAAIILPQTQMAQAAGADLTFETAPSGLQWADAKVGTGAALKPGVSATVDYVLSTTGARYGTKIYASSQLDIPYRWKLGDGSTIAGMEQAILGAEGIPPMLPGGVRRVVIPQALGYAQLATGVESVRERCVQNGTPGPIPPPNQGAFEEYQRFKNIYCNPNRQYQPDVVMDIKLYGARSQSSIK